MVEGFDVRTLAIINLVLGIVLGVGLFIFAKSHPSFSGFRRIGTGYLLLALGFVLMGFRNYISDWYSIVTANAIIFSGVSAVGVGLLRFYGRPHKLFLIFSAFLLVCLVPIFFYFTFVQNDINQRIIVISSFFSIQCLYLAAELWRYPANIRRGFTRFLSISFAIYGVVFAFRSLWTMEEANIINFMNAGPIHGVSLIIFQILIVTTGYVASWSACLKLENEITIQATIDPLTQTYNRRALDEMASKEVSRSRRLGLPVSVILTDIDLFKQVNDQHGHQVGDTVLVSFARRLKHNLREHDILARFGGEEFLVLLPDTDAPTALKIAEKLRVLVSQKTMTADDEAFDLEITASFGVSASFGKDIDWKALVSKADHALYQAKANGRNKVKGKFDYIQLVAWNDI
ncbi:GGDEF domain-containing protein [Aliikangiella coralliicola]|uniref:diguanylate cyclase n=1 Tax=Aliikangiella coralliicola TaxID=2592383 RepID=A0A545UHW1_9GAMM|nr:GGDEF domain-containing protein [Aliikangiella coralliicola]TQV89064.1 GGDEF domain-containing protein [Aliikangiella coralliicola]